MKGRKFYLFIGAVLLAVSSCVVDDLTQSSTMVLERINTLEEQSASIDASITELKKVDAALKESVEYLQSRAKEDSAAIKKINAQITELQKQDSLVNVQITELRAYTDSLAKSTQDWAKGTFATLEQYDDLCKVVAGLQAEMDSLDLAHTVELNQAISSLESSMKDWVNEKFTDYYTIDEIEVRLDALMEADSTMYKEIKDLYVALESAKEELTASYTEAINTAIKNLEGKLNDKISSDIDAAKAELYGALDVLDDRVSAIEVRVGVLEDKVNTLEGQVERINSSISDLQQVDQAIQESIEYLKARAGQDSASIVVINRQIEELKRQDSLVKEEIVELRDYVDSLSKDTRDWAKGTFATLEQFDELCAVVARLDAKMDSLDVAHTAALNQAISALETSMKDWVNEKFTDYYNMAQIDAKLEELRKADSTLNKKIDDLSAALETAKVEITAAYTQAINTAITDLEGRLNDKIENDIAAAKSALQSQIDAISEKVLVIQEQMVEVLSRIQSISVLPDLSDGSVKVVGNNATFEVRLAIYPLDAAQKIANNSYMQAGFEVVETLTKSSSAFTPYTITGMRYEDELLKLTVSTSSVDTTFYSGEKRGFARVSFTNDKYQKASGFFPLTTIYNPTAISVEYGYYCILLGEIEDIKIIPTPSYATVPPMEYVSSNPDVAFVDRGGMATAAKAGEVSIIARATDGSGLRDTCNVAVSPLTGIFSIAPDKKVVFSPGYLRARKGAKSDWSDARFFFASNQKDVLGSANIVGDALADEIDLFGWSAEGANAKWGISISCSDSDYSGTSFRDWGRNIGKGWKTMAKEEWEYLTVTRPNASSLVKAPVTITTNEGKTFKDCSIIAPDNYNFTANPLKSSYSENEIEQLGLVAIYAAGYRSGVGIHYFQERLEIWTASPDGSVRAHYIYINTSGSVGHVDQSRYYGDVVRLVREVK